MSDVTDYRRNQRCWCEKLITRKWRLQTLRCDRRVMRDAWLQILIKSMLIDVLLWALYIIVLSFSWKSPCLTIVSIWDGSYYEIIQSFVHNPLTTTSNQQTSFRNWTIFQKRQLHNYKEIFVHIQGFFIHDEMVLHVGESSCRDERFNSGYI